MKPRLRVVAGLIPDPSGLRFLVQQRPPHKDRALLWEFPGGKVEPGETDAQALVREGREELAVELSVGQLLWTTVHEYADVSVELLLHGARIIHGTPHALQAKAIRFLTPTEMLELPFCEADVPLLHALAQGQVRSE
jgi:8-oxo-dGTP diphosphatase